MKKISSIAIPLLLASPIVYAHGEDILLSIYGGIIFFILFVVFLILFKGGIVNKALLSVLVVAAYAIAWFGTIDIPYTKNIVLISAIQWGIPGMVWLLGYLGIKNKWLNT